MPGVSQLPRHLTRPAAGVPCARCLPAPGTPRERRSQRRAGPVGLGYLVQGALPHVASGQWLIMGKDDGVVLGVGLVAALPDPAAVVCE